jgi:hypothetical protein
MARVECSTKLLWSFEDIVVKSIFLYPRYINSFFFVTNDEKITTLSYKKLILKIKKFIIYISLFSYACVTLFFS